MNNRKADNRIFLLLFAVLAAAGAALRFFRFGMVPAGLNQDEASIGYDAYCLATWGMDRNGYHWPVYPISWGSGGGSPLLDYLVTLSTALFGKNIYSLRLVPALLGSLTPPLLALLPFAVPQNAEQNSEASGSLRQFFSLAILFPAVVNPWHLMMSRWTLDANILPFFLTLSVLSFLHAAASTVRRLPKYLLSAFCFALCTWSYGSATLVVPLALVLIGICCVRNGRMTLRELFLSALIFVLTLSPLILFFAVNLSGRGPIETPWFSVPVLTASRSVFSSGSELLSLILNNIRYLIIFFTVGAERDELYCNVLPGFAQMYRFTFPLTLGGIFLSVRRMQKKHPEDTIFVILTGCTAVFSLFIELDINRMTMLLVPFLYFQALALQALWQKKKAAAAAVCALILCGALLFTHDYFGERYRELACSDGFFMPGYAEAAQAAAATAGDGKQIVSTYTRVAAPFVVALYATGTPPEEFRDTVVWKDETAEFRIASAFSDFVFGLPEDLSGIDLDRQVLILHQSELDGFPGIEAAEITAYGDFALVRKP